MLLSRAWEMYESDKRIEGFSPHTLKAYQLQATLLIRYFNDIEIGPIVLQLLEEKEIKKEKFILIFAVIFGLNVT